MLINEQIRQQYFKQFKTFLTQVKKCLPTDLELFESTTYFKVTDVTGTYQAEVATIYRKNIPKPDNFVADIIPFGVTISPGEGILEFSGAFGEERFIYLCRNTVSQIEYHSGMFCMVSQDVPLDGWYWLEKSVNNHAIFVTCELLLDLIDRVNCCEFYHREDERIWE